MATNDPIHLIGENPDWEPCGPDCEGWHVFANEERGLEIEACDEAGRFTDSRGVSRDDWAERFAGWRGFAAFLVALAREWPE